LQHISYSILKALDHLKKYDTIHNDIKPANILVSHNGDVKVGDLGLACHVHGMSTDARGTLAFCSPERLLSQPHSFPADVWALGITLIAVATGKVPFSGSTGFIHLQDMVVNKPIPGLSENTETVIRIDGSESKSWSPEFLAFITCMLIKNPEKRLSANTLLKNRFMETHNAKDFEETNGKYSKEWQECIGTSAIDGSELLPEIRRRMQEHLGRNMGVLCRRVVPSKNGFKEKWKKLKDRFLPTTAFSPHPFIGVWDGVLNLSAGLRLPTLEVETALGLRASITDAPETQDEPQIDKARIFSTVQTPKCAAPVAKLEMKTESLHSPTPIDSIVGNKKEARKSETSSPKTN